MIEIKNKRCRGTGRAVGYGCGKMVPESKYNKPNRVYGLGISCGCYSNWLLNTEEGNKKLQKSTLTGKNKAKTQAKKEFQKKKIEHKSITSLIQEVRTPFQKLIRIRDHGKKCICCDRPLPFNIGDYDAGHYFKAELYTGLIFHPDNVHGQLVYCNKHNYGNESGYNQGLKARIGNDLFDNLSDISKGLRSYSWSKTKLSEMKKFYNKELKLVEKGTKDISEVDFSIGIIII